MGLPQEPITMGFLGTRFANYRLFQACPAYLTTYVVFKMGVAEECLRPFFLSGLRYKIGRFS